MYNIRLACGNDIELFEEVENLLDENCSRAWDLMNEYSIEEIEEYGLNRCLFEYYDKNYDEMYCEDWEDVIELKEEIEEDNKILYNIEL